MQELKIELKGYATETNARRAALAWLANRQDVEGRWWTVVAQNGRFIPLIHVGRDGNPGLFLGGPFLIIN